MYITIRVLSPRPWHCPTHDQTTPLQRPELLKSFISVLTGHGFPALSEIFQRWSVSVYLNTAATEVARFYYEPATNLRCCCSTWLARLGWQIVRAVTFLSMLWFLHSFLKGTRQHSEACDDGFQQPLASRELEGSKGRRWVTESRHCAGHDTHWKGQFKWLKSVKHSKPEDDSIRLWRIWWVHLVHSQMNIRNLLFLSTSGGSTAIPVFSLRWIIIPLWY